MAIGAVIMAGGEGVRLRPMTLDMPKPLMPLLGRPVMAYALDLLKRHGVQSAAVTLCYRADMIKKAFARDTCGVKLFWCEETTPLGTAGSVKLAASEALETFFVLSGDGLTDVDLTKALQFHREKGALATLVLRREREPLPYGVVMTNDDGRILDFIEKPAWPRVYSDLVNTGIYILEKELLQYIPNEGRPDFGRDIFPALLRAHAPLYGYQTDGYWRDIGSLRAYLSAQEALMTGRVHLPCPPRIAPDALIDSGAFVDEASYILSGACIEKGARVEKSVIGQQAFVGQGARVSGSCLMRRAFVCAQARAQDSVLCAGARLSRGAELMAGAALGAGANVAKGGRVLPGVSVFPHMTVPEMAVAEENLFSAEPMAIRALTDGVAASTPGAMARVGAAMAAKTAHWVLTGRREEPFLYALLGALLAHGAQVSVLFGPRVFAPAFGQGMGTCAAHVKEEAVSCYDAFGLPFSQRECQALARAALGDAPPPLMYGKGRARFDLNAQDAYLSRLPQGASPRAVLRVVSADEELSRLIARAFPERTDAPTLLLCAGGTAYALTNRGKRLPKETTALLCASLLAREGTLRARDELPRAALERYMWKPYGHDALSGRHYAAFHDGFVFGRLLSKALLERPLDAWLDALPKTAVRERRVPCDIDGKSRVLARLSKRPEAFERGEGLTFQDARGAVTIVPDALRNLVHVTAEAANAEIADELCARWAELTRDRGD